MLQMQNAKVKMNNDNEKLKIITIYIILFFILHSLFILHF